MRDAIPWAPGPVGRAGLLDLRVGRQAATRLRSIADDARSLAPAAQVLVALHGSRALGTARRGSDHDVAVLVGGGLPYPGFRDDLRDLCLPHVLDGFLVHAVAEGFGPGAPSPLAAAVLRDGIAVMPREGADG
jgi:hypothetical protein